MSRISHIDLDDSGLPVPTAEIEQERKVAMFDLLENNSFALPKREDREVPQGPFRLGLSIKERRLVFDLKLEDETPAGEFHLSLGPFRQVVKDYFQICESYFDAVKNMPPSQIETLLSSLTQAVHCHLGPRASMQIPTARKYHSLHT